MRDDYADAPPPDPDEEEAPSTEQLTEEAPRTTDSANADAIVREHGRGFLYVAEWDSWIAWDGKRWDRTGAKGRVMHVAMLTARLEHYRTKDRLAALVELARLAGLKGQKDEDLEHRIKQETRLLKWHEQSQNVSRIEAATKLLESRLVISLKDLDRDPWLLNVRNGTIDLRTAELGPHDPRHLITQIADVEWDDAAPCPTWTEFVNQAMGGQLELVLYLQRLVGYALTGLITEHMLAFFHGAGRNGKSTFVQTVRAMMGEYACAAPRDLLFEDKPGGTRHPVELARLYGKRMAVCAEIGEHVTLDEAKVKDLTGGDSVAVRRMREDFWDLEPTHKLFVSGNHKPTVRGDDLGIWRRIRLIPWEVTVAEDQVDKALPDKLRRELPGILRWSVIGCIDWQEHGMGEPMAVTQATKDYRQESDVLGEFLAARAIFEENARTSRQMLREAYERWCEEAGVKPLSPRKAAQRLKERGVSGTTVREGGRVRDGWAGVRLKTELELQFEAEPGSNTLKS